MTCQLPTEAQRRKRILDALDEAMSMLEEASYQGSHLPLDEIQGAIADARREVDRALRCVR